MQKLHLLKFGVLLLTIAMLSGCILRPPPLPPTGGGGHDRGRHSGHHKGH